MSNKNKLLDYFFLNPTAKLRVREIERKVKIPLPSVIRYCSELEKEGFLVRMQISNIFVYCANRANKRFLFKKKLFNLEQIYNLVEYLSKESYNSLIILFGSYSRGEDIETSDIDLFIEGKSIDVSLFEKKLQRKVQIFAFNKLEEVPNPKLQNSILNGIVLNGYIDAELRRVQRKKKSG